MRLDEDRGREAIGPVLELGVAAQHLRHSVRTLTSPEQRPAGRDGPGSGVGGCSNR